MRKEFLMRSKDFAEELQGLVNREEASPAWIAMALTNLCAKVIKELEGEERERYKLTEGKMCHIVSMPIDAMELYNKMEKISNFLETKEDDQ